MPVYEYRCEECQAESSVRFSSFAQAAAGAARCAACGSERVRRMVSRIVIGRGGGTPQAARADAGAPRGTDPRALAQQMRAAAEGRSMGGDFQEVATRLASGEQSMSVESSLRRRVGERMEGH